MTDTLPCEICKVRPALYYFCWPFVAEILSLCQDCWTVLTEATLEDMGNDPESLSALYDFPAPDPQKEFDESMNKSWVDLIPRETLPAIRKSFEVLGDDLPQAWMRAVEKAKGGETRENPERENQVKTKKTLRVSKSKSPRESKQ